jgi:hypothetical protein
MYTFSPENIAEDWLRCKEAHTAAKEQWAICQHFDREAAAPFFQHLAEMAGAFKVVHGIEFDPKTPIVVPERYEAAEEARDFDFSVEAHNSEMREEA